MSYLLDSNTCIEILRPRFPHVRAHFMGLGRGTVFISAIVYGELLVGQEKNLVRSRLALPLEQLLRDISILPLDDSAARHYARIRAHLETRGQIIGTHDLWIAAHALSLDFTLVTENLREFRRVPGLKVENWVQRRA
jgi:tRNA(fMet)-specific endonuclease VapC